MVTSVAADILKVAVEEGLLTNVSPKIFMIEEKAANAFVLPSGDIFVFTGILPFAKDKDGLAAVLAHEVKNIPSSSKDCTSNRQTFCRKGFCLLFL